MLKDPELTDATKIAIAKDYDTVLSLDLLRGLNAPKEAADEELISYIEAKIQERKEAKKAKDFAKADAIRQELLEKGILLKDTREGVKWTRA